MKSQNWKYILLYVVVVDADSDVVADFDIFDRAAVKTYELVYSVYNSFSCIMKAFWATFSRYIK